jgi:hypothetical protein
MERCRLIGLGLIMVFVSGCGVGMKESLRGVAGISTKILDDNISSAEAKEFALGYDAVYSKTREIIAEIKAYIYAVDDSKNLVAIYVSNDDTTPVGIFFKKIDGAKTQVRVSSPSRFAREFIAAKIFSGLGK